jgi:tRNA splicing endonuclease
LFEHGYLSLTHADGTHVTLEQLWRQFFEKNGNFPLKYKVYAFFRDQG